MAIDLNDEIVQDFLLEAGEILESLNEQLVDLESSPDDKELLNAVFRNFHTIKGGAGFLAIDPLVEVCHKAENIFDLLRNGQRSVDANLMDIVLQVLDVVNEMFADISNGSDPSEASPDLMQHLLRLSVPEGESEEQSEQQDLEPTNEPESSANESNDAPEAASDDISDDEFEQLLDNLHGSNNTQAKTSNVSNSDDITDEEFEDLLNQLHGDKKIEAANASGQENSESPKSVSKQDDSITDDEFEQLLDNLEAKKTENADVKTKQPVADKKEPSKVEKPAEKKVVDIAAKSKPVEKATAPNKTTAPKQDTTVRVETSILDRIMNMVGELVLVRNRLSNLESTLGNEDVSVTVSNLDVVTADLQSSVLKTRMQPIKKVFGRFPRVVRDLARNLNKEVNLEMIGEETDLDKNLVEALADPLVHLVRNSIDHGVELPDEREAAGKPRSGTVVLSAEQEGDHILLTIKDDGKGMDAEVLRKKVVEKGILDEDAASRLDETDCYNLIFMPGFSTKEEISDVSGRGVGMDVVKTRINQLNGIIFIDSKLGEGTKIEIKVPLTLAIMPTLMVKLGEKGQIFALPLVSVNEIIDLDMEKINTVDGQKVVIVRGKPLPLYYLSNWLTSSGDRFEEQHGHVVVVTIGTSHIALLVDSLLGREEVVIKPLGAMLSGTKGLAGATITGNGKIALIIDLPELIGFYAHQY